MSDKVPRFKFGERVRIMQTTEMEESGLANRTGTVMSNQRTPSNAVAVALDSDGERELNVEVSVCSLMRLKGGAT